MENKNYSSDSPVFGQDEDRFSRWNFSERIAQVISRRGDPSSIVIGLYGVWGDGKTSVLNFIQKALSNDNNVICIKFNPWRFGTEDELLTGFFIDIATALDAELIQTGEKLKDILKRAAPTVGGILGSESAGKLVSSFLSGPNINELKNRIEHELEKAKRRVLILIDDIDRLEKSEIHAIFRLVKLTADFKYTSYILAFDKDIVTASLQDRYSSSINNAGEAFLEKIIQVPLHLPSVEKAVLREFCFQGVDEALTLAEIELSSQQVQEFVRDFTYAFDDCLTTPRKAKLYGNTLMFSLPILKGEINPVDLMLLEGIRVFCPALYDAIRKNKNLFVGVFRDSHYSNNEKEKEFTRNLVDSALNYINDLNKQGYLELLKNLFPKLRSVYGNMSYDSSWYKQWDSDKRICSENYFSRYFTYSIPIGDISDQAIEKLVASCKENVETNQQRDNSLASILTAKNSEALIRKLRLKAKNFTKDESFSLAIEISRQSALYPNPDILFNWMSPFVQAAMLISNLIQNLGSGDRVKLACVSISNANGIDFMLEIFRWLERKEEGKPEKDAFSNEEIEEIGNHLAKHIESYFNSGVDITLRNPKSTQNLLYTVQQYLGQDFLNNYFDTILKEDSDAILRLLDAYTSTAWGMETGVSHKSDFERWHYDSLTKILSPDVIISAIVNRMGELPKIDADFPRDYEYEDRSILFRQFLWLHKCVIKESSITS